jgi:hypothetical protein
MFGHLRRTHGTRLAGGWSLHDHPPNFLWNTHGLAHVAGGAGGFSASAGDEPDPFFVHTDATHPARIACDGWRVVTARPPAKFLVECPRVSARGGWCGWFFGIHRR